MRWPDGSFRIPKRPLAASTNRVGEGRTAVATAPLAARRCWRAQAGAARTCSTGSAPVLPSPASPGRPATGAGQCAAAQENCAAHQRRQAGRRWWQAGVHLASHAQAGQRLPGRGSGRKARQGHAVPQISAGRHASGGSGREGPLASSDSERLSCNQRQLPARGESVARGGTAAARQAVSGGAGAQACMSGSGSWSAVAQGEMGVGS